MPSGRSGAERAHTVSATRGQGLLCQLTFIKHARKQLHLVGSPRHMGGCSHGSGRIKCWELTERDPSSWAIAAIASGFSVSSAP